MFVRTKQRGTHTYLMIVENKRVDGRIQQTVLHHLGRLDRLRVSAQLDALFHSLGRLREDLDVLGAHQRGESITTRTTRIGPALMFERLWRQLGIDQVLNDRLAGRKFGFAVERAVFLTVLYRLFDPGRDRAAEKWEEQSLLQKSDL